MKPGARRRLKIRGGNLGPFLCWAVVFADIGTSIYYVPGILYGPYRTRATLFVLMTLVVFVLLTVKYAEVSWRYPEGGGVVTVASRAIHPFAGLLGGLFIIVDYYLTAALSALSGFYYIAAIVPSLYPLAVPLAMAALVGLAVLNWMGIRESAKASAVFAVAAGSLQVLVVLVVFLNVGPLGFLHSVQAIGNGPRLTAPLLITGYAAAFLAFSGLESIAQVAPAMREPRRLVAGRAMFAVVLTMAVTSPLLTLFSTTLLGPGADPNQYISILGAHVAGPVLGYAVALSGALLLVFASNTAIIGGYHVFVALARMGFLPRPVEDRNKWRHTPHWAILLAALVPVALVKVSDGSPELLGDLYAFGLLGAISLTCIGLDIVRWHEQFTRAGSLRRAGYVVGVMTTVAVVVAWCVNLVNKPLATEFGGGLTILGLIIGFATYWYYRQRRPRVFPLPYRPNRPIVHLLAGMRLQPAQVMVILPHDHEVAEPLLYAAADAAAGRPVLFVYRGDYFPDTSDELLEVVDPYLKDFHAQDAFARAERLGRQRGIHDRRYIYVPGSLPRSAMADVWRQVHPRDTIVVEGEQDALPPMAIDRIRRQSVEGATVLHLISRKDLPAPLSA
ncbi:MAG TPA: APC family permease [Candidatus Dormibacteraeota bacterium]